ncbi:hypothetical protein FHS02_000699 [Massilia umbonata]|uniref:Uncharacterized protein n=1 Tax=Pseudoduganella umbonata TaxID=864828 RepID=A0A7W5HAG4_9BURK|nr:hypothetical protein [Pseudoduganella umbonata]
MCVVAGDIDGLQEASHAAFIERYRQRYKLPMDPMPV